MDARGPGSHQARGRGRRPPAGMTCRTEGDPSLRSGSRELLDLGLRARLTPAPLERAFHEICPEIPERPGEFSALVEHGIERGDEAGDLLLPDDERRKDFYHIEAVPGDLREDAVLLEERGD